MVFSRILKLKDGFTSMDIYELASGCCQVPASAHRLTCADGPGMVCSFALFSLLYTMSNKLLTKRHRAGPVGL